MHKSNSGFVVSTAQNPGHRRLHSALWSLWRNRDGVAGIEFAVIAGVLIFLLLNGIDVARYAHIKMQVENAAQAGAQAAWKACDPAKLPATILCSGLTAAITAAITSTSLGTGVQLQSGSPSEGYYCLDNSGGLRPVGNLSTKPDDCTDVNMPQLKPGNYIKVHVTYSYAPLFSELTVARFFGTSIASSAHMRLL
jgi:Flp pilus assembly protein TadG